MSGGQLSQEYSDSSDMVNETTFSLFSADDNNTEDDFTTAQIEQENYDTEMDNYYETLKMQNEVKEWLASANTETRAEFVARQLKESEEWWQANKQYVNTLPLKAKVRQPATEAEMDAALKEMYALMDAEEEQKRVDAILQTSMCEWFEAHPESKIPVNGTFEEQWTVYHQEIMALKAKQAEIVRVQTATALMKEAIERKKAGRKAAKARELKKKGLNSKGKDQGRDKKKAVQEMAAKKVAEEKTLKVQGKESTYMGKRALRKSKAVQVTIVPREMLVEQPKFFEDEVETEVEEVVTKVETNVVTEVVVAPPLKPIKVEVVEAKVEVAEEVNDDDFVDSLLGARGIKVAPKIVKINTVPKVKKQKVLLFEVGTSIIQQARSAKYPKADAGTVESVRTAAFEILDDKKKQEVVFARTRMCNSVGTNKPCKHGKRCRFAHTPSELTIRDCKFGESCRMVVAHPTKGCVNHVGKAGHPCGFKHPHESTEQYHARMGIKTQTAVRPVQAPITLPVQTPPSKPYTAPVAPWTRPVQPVVAPRKTRWDQAPTPTPTPTPTPVVVAPTPTPVPSPPRKSRFDQTPKTKIIRVPREMAEKALEMCLRQGLVDFQIEYTN